jgi:NAD(P)-dependent dehydrogenase (short-subunit alcohol dehydrogenase family)
MRVVITGATGFIGRALCKELHKDNEVIALSRNPDGARKAIGDRIKVVRSNPKAAYMFIEQSEGYVGKRLYLTMTGEEKDPERIEAIKQLHSRSFGKQETIST